MSNKAEINDHPKIGKNTEPKRSPKNAVTQNKPIRTVCGLRDLFCEQHPQAKHKELWKIHRSIENQSEGCKGKNEPFERPLGCLDL